MHVASGRVRHKTVNFCILGIYLDLGQKIWAARKGLPIQIELEQAQVPALTVGVGIIPLQRVPQAPRVLPVPRVPRFLLELFHQRFRQESCHLPFLHPLL